MSRSSVVGKSANTSLSQSRITDWRHRHDRYRPAGMDAANDCASLYRFQLHDGPWLLSQATILPCQ
jgi:hypothetical protein